jgi:6-phosphogluconolactonase
MASKPSPSEQNPRLLIGTYTEPNESKSEGVYVYRLDMSSGKLSYESVVKNMPNVSFMAKHPRSGLIYAVNETEEFEGQPGGGVTALSSSLSVLNKQSSGGENPCYISIEKTGRFALVANYESGRVAMLPIAANGQLLPASDVVQHAGFSVHPERQTSPHPHCILPDPANRFAIAADLGLDKLLIYRMDLEAGKLQKHAEIEVDARSGPRHLIFNASGQYAYLLNELNSTLIVYHYDSEMGVFGKLQIVPTLPEDFSGENFCADIHLSKDENYLYVSNRGHDSIVCFKVHASSGELSYQSHIRSGGHHPRIFAIDPNGRFLVAIHQKSSNVVVFQINPETGDLAPTGHEVAVSMPVHILFAELQASNFPHTFS